MVLRMVLPRAIPALLIYRKGRSQRGLGELVCKRWRLTRTVGWPICEVGRSCQLLDITCSRLYTHLSANSLGNLGNGGGVGDVAFVPFDVL